ncbi:2,3-bisphosphoglycerate-independent phosphoglycerate mutase [Candidatus Falkowbacteria bacterium]|nr:2,3-bisphosphoglycerate-independent phosphoglycerate mutase [Candidatus Falkowbacteria bacterium]
MPAKKPTILAILDGWGEWDIDKGNPIKKVDLPTFRELDRHYPKVFLQASGLAVGLPWGIRGNSEVGHQTIGSGQIVFQYLPTITTSIADGSFFQNKTLKSAFSEAKNRGSTLHFWGLLSDGGVHSHIDHLFALVEMAKMQGFEDLCLHVVTDGRDTHPQSAKGFLQALQKKINTEQVGRIATLNGRYYAMDRNNNWDRTEKAFLAMTEGKGMKADDPLKAIDEQYSKGTTDEFLEPVVIVGESGNPIGLLKDNDVVVCFNFRKDRSRQMTRAMALADFSEFKEAKTLNNIKYICFAQYEEGLPVDIVFTTKKITSRLGEVLSQNGKKQLRIAETEKYAHVTYFFNGGEEKPYEGEDRIVVPSKRVKSYAEVPEMSAPEVMEKLLKAIDDDRYDFILVNFANPDMVGHTGVIEAAEKAIRHIDEQVRILINKTIEKQGRMIITADHGNVEEMLNIHTGEIDTQHSKNPVPCWYVSADSYNKEGFSKDRQIGIDGMLIDLAPTILDVMEIEKPQDMIGTSLLPFWDM